MLMLKTIILLIHLFNVVNHNSMIMKKIPLIIAVLIGLITYIGYQDTMFMFNTSAPVSCAKLGFLPITLSIILFLAFCVILLVNFKNKKTKILLLAIVFILWLLVGRVVGYNVWNNSIVGGWQNIIKTREICIGSHDQSKIGFEIKNTHITKLSFWRLKIENTKVRTSLYVGPFIWKETEAVLRNEGFNINN